MSALVDAEEAILKRMRDARDRDPLVPRLDAFAEKLRVVLEERRTIIREIVGELAPKFCDDKTKRPFDKILEDPKYKLTIEHVLDALHGDTVYYKKLLSVTLVPIDPTTCTFISTDAWSGMRELFHEFECDDIAYDPWALDSKWREYAQYCPDDW